MNVYDNTPESLNLIHKVLLEDEKATKEKSNTDSKLNLDLYETHDNEFECLDDTILNDMKDNLLYDKDKNIILKDIKSLCYGDYFGGRGIINILKIFFKLWNIYFFFNY